MLEGSDRGRKITDHLVITDIDFLRHGKCVQEFG